MNDENNLSFIFFLTLDERLPKAFYVFNEHLKKRGFVPNISIPAYVGQSSLRS
jgi:hypothetical protein